MIRGSGDEDWSYARVNTTVEDGDAIWTNENGLAEIELAQNTFLRLGYGSSITLNEVSPDAQWRLENGSAYVQWSRGDGRLLLTTPTADVYLRKSAVARVDVANDGSTRVAVHKGKAEVAETGGKPVEVGDGWRIYVYPGQAPGDRERLTSSELDKLDEFNRTREKYIEAYTPPPYIDRGIIGWYDLPSYGVWVNIDNVHYWRPRDRNWQPYRYGRWGWVGGYGRCWIDDYPWGYVTGHYGRWRWMASHGWLWAPGPTWGPGWVYWGDFDDYICWAPLDPWDRPCHTSIGISIGIGDHGFFSLYAGCYAPRPAFYGGYVTPHVFDHHVTNIIQHTHINVFNQNVFYLNGHHGHGRPGEGAFSHIVRPRQALRGALTRDGGRPAPALVHDLKTSESFRSKNWSWAPGMRERARTGGVAGLGHGQGGGPSEHGHGPNGATVQQRPHLTFKPSGNEPGNAGGNPTPRPHLSAPGAGNSHGQTGTGTQGTQGGRPRTIWPGQGNSNAGPSNQPTERPRVNPGPSGSGGSGETPSARPRTAWPGQGSSNAGPSSQPTERPRLNSGPSGSGGSGETPSPRPRTTWPGQGSSNAGPSNQPTERPRVNPGPSGSGGSGETPSPRPRTAWPGQGSFSAQPRGNQGESPRSGFGSSERGGSGERPSFQPRSSSGGGGGGSHSSWGSPSTFGNAAPGSPRVGGGGSSGERGSFRGSGGGGMSLDSRRGDPPAQTQIQKSTGPSSEPKGKLSSESSRSGGSRSGSRGGHGRR